MEKMTVEERKALASTAAKARWRKVEAGEYASLINEDATQVTETANLPVAKWPGMLTIGNVEIPVYVLDDGRRIVSRTGATTVLTGGKGGGNLESYVQVRALEPYMPANLQGRMIDFSIPEVVNRRSNDEPRHTTRDRSADWQGHAVRDRAPTLLVGLLDLSQA